MRAPVILSEYQASWVIKFEKEKTLLNNLIGKWSHGSIEHVGSTAIPDLIAKPIIDIMFGVQSLEASKPCIDILGNNGYEYSPYKTEVMHWFCKPSDSFRTHHVHLIPYLSPLWKERITFRNELRKNKEIRNKYANLKIKLADENKNDREKYTELKWPFIEGVLMHCKEQLNKD